MLKWQKEVEEIIKKQFPDGDSSDLLKEATKIVGMADQIDPPAGDLGKVINEVMTWASRELPSASFNLRRLYARCGLGESTCWIK